MNDILTDDMKRVFKDCKKEGLSRILIYLEDFKNPEEQIQATFKRKDIPLMKVWVASQKEEQRKNERKEERWWNLASVIIGALIAAGVALFTANIYLKNLSEQHTHTMKQQERAIEETFRNGFNLMLLQYKTESELRFLEDIYASIENDFEPLFPGIHKMRNNWKEQLVDMGKTAYLQKLDDIRYRISEAIKKFAKLLKKNSHHKKIYDEFYMSLSFQSKYSNPISDFRRDIDLFPDGFTVGNLKILDSKGEKFSEAVSVLRKWIENTKKLAQDKQQEIYKLSQEEIKDKDT